MDYRIERAKSGRSSCRHCGMTIDKGVYRFGKSGQISRWFHLGCAAEGSPRAFKPFREEAAKLLKAEPEAEPAPTAPRNLEAEAVLARNPEDGEARQVFVDVLLAAGDPWGEILALYAADRDKEARKLFKRHQADLTGGLALKLFTFERGFLTSVGPESRSKKKIAEQLERVFGLRTACTLRRVAVPRPPDRTIVELVSEKAPPSVRSLFFHYDPSLDHLSRPGVEELSLFVLADPVVAHGLFGAEGLPDLRSLQIYSNSNPLPALFLRSLLVSPLVGQLTSLRLFQGALDSAGAEVVLDLAEHLEGIPELSLDVPPRDRGAVVKRLGVRAKAW